MKRKINEIYPKDHQPKLFDVGLKKLKEDNNSQIKNLIDDKKKEIEIEKLSNETEILEDEEESKEIEIEIKGKDGIIKKIAIQPNYFNVLFYKNKICCIPNGDYIQQIHKSWFRNYEKLEIHHGYVQWLFPNFYKSRFNSCAHHLLKEEAAIFRNDQQIINNLLFSYKLILDFFGIKLVDSKKGIFERTENYEIRYFKTFLTSFHNHMRIERILSHWNVVGFRLFAIHFVRYLEKEIYGPNGFRAFLKQMVVLKDKSECLKSIKDEDAPLKKLINYNCFTNWRVYGEINERIQTDVYKIEEMCQEKLENMKVPSLFLIEKTFKEILNN